MEPTTAIHWPDGLSEQLFLDQYWQQQPLLIRQALPGFTTPLPADELAGLSLEPETTPKLITQDNDGQYQLEHGPFDPALFESLTGNNWSLLVTDVEKHVPELKAYLEPFRFLPTWRIDDLMISYAPVGASVGAHIDEYDVFLLQASGTRQWSINDDAKAVHEWVADSDLKILANFEATDCWELKAGDLLYLPPGIAHHGIAVAEQCTTWSIGFRAPAIPDLVMKMAELLCEALPHGRYTDPPLKPARPGEITADAQLRLQRIWKEATDLDKQTINRLAGQVLTESAGGVAEHGSMADACNAQGEFDCHCQTLVVKLSPFSQVLWHEPDSELSNDSGKITKAQHCVNLYVDGNTYQCSRKLAIQLSELTDAVTISSSTHCQEDRDVCNTLLEVSSLVVVEIPA